MLGEPKPEVSTVVENYLQAIYKLKDSGQRVNPAKLAEVMGLSPPTVAGTLKRLDKQGMIRVEQDKEISFTPYGLELGEAVVRRHRLAERMLTELLGAEWYMAHGEAHRLEHAISPYLEEKLAKALGYPKTNPYGRPIPGYVDPVNVTPQKPMSDTAVGDITAIEIVPEDDPLLLKFLDENDLRPGTQVEILELAKYKGTITFRVAEENVVLGIDVAKQILVRA